MSRTYSTGVGSRACICLQSAFDTPSSANPILLNYRSESITSSVTKETEETLLSSRTATESVLTGVQVQGNISCLLKPEMKSIFKLALGYEQIVDGLPTGVYTLAEADDDCPYFTLYIERGNVVYKYADCTMTGLSMQCDAQRTVTVDMSIRGRREETGTFPTVQSFVKHSYKCTEAYLKRAIGQSVVELDVETLNLNINNNLQSAPTTYKSGIYVDESSYGTRNVALSFTLPYSSSYRDIISNNLEDDGWVAFELKFTNGDEDFVKVVMPCVSIQSGSANVSGTGIINGSINGICLSIGSTEPITIIAQTE